ncbi:MAG: hypothetical protein ABI321_00290 [Polyangia bacterium]
MSDKKSIGKKVLGWFVQPEEGEEQHDASADELIAKYANDAPPPAPPPEVTLTGELPKVQDGKVDFPAVFRAAGVDDEEQGRVEKARGLLSTLPAVTPKDVQKQIVEAALKAFGYPVDAIIEAGAQEIQALEVYIQAGARDTQSLLADSTKRLDQLEAEMANVKKVMNDKVSEQQTLKEACNQEKLRVQGVLEFFGQDAINKVVAASPKLHEPK